MEHIDKKEPIEAFTNFVSKTHPSSWDDLHKEPGPSLQCRTYILQEEQHMLGGYTERPLNSDDEIHIDHFRKKGMPWPNDVTFDWNNLVVEDRCADYGTCYKDKHTSSMADYDLQLNPVEDYPERLFSYNQEGFIFAKPGIDDNERIKAEFTIERFNLNHATLKQMRLKLIRTIGNYTNQLDADTIRQCVANEGFPSVVEWMVGGE